MSVDYVSEQDAQVRIMSALEAISEELARMGRFQREGER